MSRPLLSLSFLALLSAHAIAGGVRIVDATGAGTFPNVQAAVDAAAEGDVLLVGQGTYPGFSIAGKGLVLVADAPVVVEGGVEVSDLPAGSNVVLSGFLLRAGTWQDAVRATDCAGVLRIEKCRLEGGDDTFTESTHAGAALRIEGCAAVSVIQSELVGGSTWGSSGAPSPPGGPGIRALGSGFSVHDSSVRGGDGIQNELGASDGGHGCQAEGGSTFFAAGSTFRGGTSEHGCGDGVPAYGGHGLLLDGTGEALSDCSFFGGGNIDDCLGNGSAPAVSGCCLQTSPGNARTFELAAVSGDGRTSRVLVRGQPGDRVFLLASDRPMFEPAPSLLGTWLIEQPLTLSALPLGTLTSGVLQVDLRIPALPPGSAREVVYLQGLAWRANGPPVLGDSSTLVVLAQDSLPDCDQDGVQDYLATLEGLAPDSNHDLVPDTCQWAGPTWHVDATAPGPGTGAPGDPFPSIGAAFAAASTGHTILVADGLYSGAANRDLDFAGRDLVVQSLNGPAACIVDCEGQGRGFLLVGGSLAGARLEGFTVRNGDAARPHPEAGYGNGGGVYIGWPASPLVQDCVISSCSAETGGDESGFGGGMYVANGTPRILDTTFAGNVASRGGGGLFLSGRSIVRDCTFVDNEVTGGGNYYGGGGLFCRPNSSVIDRCLFQGNSSNAMGGGVGLMGVLGQPTVLARSILVDNVAQTGGGVAIKGVTANYGAEVHDCLIAGNVAWEGGGAAKFGSPTIRFSGCTFVDNDSVEPGGAFRHVPWLSPTHGLTILSDCILWRNLAPQGKQIDSTAPQSTHLRYSLLMNGAAGASGNVALGAGILAGNPQFLDLVGPDGIPSTHLDNDYGLSPGSPCIDAGSNLDLPVDFADGDGDGVTGEPNPFDLALNPRVVDDPAAPNVGLGTAPLVDVGAYERQP